MKKVIIVLLLVSILCLCLVACDEKATESAVSSSPELKSISFCGGDYNDLITGTSGYNTTYTDRYHQTNKLYLDIYNFINKHKVERYSLESVSDSVTSLKSYYDVANLSVTLYKTMIYDQLNSLNAYVFYVAIAPDSFNTANYVLLEHNTTITFYYYE